MPAVVHYDKDGEVVFYTTEGEIMLIIDDRCPNDRVFQVSCTMHTDELDLIIRGETVGSSSDERHAAVAARIEELVSGRPRLSVVNPEWDPAS